MKPNQLAKIVNAWDTIPVKSKVILFLGVTGQGKTTIAQLINKYAFGNIDPAFVFEKSQYLMENRIAKSFKIQTTQPRLYPSKKQDQLSIIDVPCYCMTPEKKWTQFQQKITVNQMLGHVKQVGLLFFVDEKKTRTAVEWKKAFFALFQFFKDFPDDLLNSVGWIMTKCGNDLNEDTLAKRLRHLQEEIKKEKLADTGLIDRIFDSIINSGHYYVGKKSTGKQELESEEIAALYKGLGKLANYDSSKDHISDKMNWNGEEEGTIKEYLEKCDKDFGKVAEAIKQILSQLPRISYELVEEINKRYFISPENEVIVGENVRSKLKDKERNIQVWQIIQVFRQIKNVLLKLEEEDGNMEEVISKVMSLPFFFRDCPEEQQFQQIMEAVRFSTSTNITIKWSQTTSKLKQIFITERQQFFKCLQSIVQDHECCQFYQNVIQLLEEQQKLNEQNSAFLQYCKDEVVKYRSPKKMIEKQIELVQGDDKDKQVDAACKIGSTMEKEGYVKQALKVFRAAKSPGDIMRCFQLMQAENQSSASSYISYLAEINLFETAKKCCYDFCVRFGPSSRRTFGELLKKVIEQEQEYMKSSKGDNPLLHEVALSKEEVGQIVEEAKAVSAKLKE